MRRGKASVLQSRPFFTLISGFALVGALVVVAFLLLARQTESTGWVIHTLDVQNKLTALLSRLQDAETGQRGFLLTGDTDFAAVRVRNADRKFGWLARKIGLFLSTFEMRSLLLGTLAQPVVPDPRDPSKTVNAIHLRDVHDLYKYGIMPAAAEERLNSAGLLTFPPVHSYGAGA
jgi:CHASE3 domain